MDFNLTQIEEDPNHCWNRMTPLQLQRFEDRYYARIEKEMQRVIRIAELEDHKLAVKAMKEQKYVFKVVAIFQRIGRLHEHDLDDKMIRFHGRSVGNDIHDLPRIWTGYESKRSIEQPCPEYKHCNEHFWPRQYAGEQIIRHIIAHKGIEFDILEKMLNKFRQVHRVTPEENRNLMKYQSSYTFVDPETSYEQAGIILVKQE